MNKLEWSSGIFFSIDVKKFFKFSFSLLKERAFNVFYFLKGFYFLVAKIVNSTKPAKLLYKWLLSDWFYIFNMAAIKNSDEEPQLSNIVMHTIRH